MKQEFINAGLTTAPPVTVSAAVASGAVDPQWFVVIPTAVFVVAQLAYLLWKWRQEYKKTKNKRG